MAKELRASSRNASIQQWQALLTAPLLIVGGTPGGLYRLLKQGAARGRQLDWSEA